MNKSKLSAPGKEYRLQPIPKHRESGNNADAKIVVISSDQKGLKVKHLDTGLEGFLYFDSIKEYREPDHLMIKGQTWVEAAKLVVEPWFDERQLESVARAQGLGLYRVPQQVGAEPNPDYDKILEILSGSPTPEKRAELKRLLPIARDKTNELQIIIGLVAWHDARESPANAEALCTRGMQLADQLKLPTAKAILQSYRALYRTQEFMSRDTDAVFRVKISNKLGVAMISEEELARITESLDKLSASIEADLKGALDGAKGSNDIDQVGASQGQAA